MDADASLKLGHCGVKHVDYLISGSTRPVAAMLQPNRLLLSLWANEPKVVKLVPKQIMTASTLHNHEPGGHSMPTTKWIPSKLRVDGRCTGVGWVKTLEVEKPRLKKVSKNSDAPASRVLGTLDQRQIKPTPCCVYREIYPRLPSVNESHPVSRVRYQDLFVATATHLVGAAFPTLRRV